MNSKISINCHSSIKISDEKIIYFDPYDINEKISDADYIFITHDLGVVRWMSDRIMVMQRGEIVELDKADRVMDNPQSQYTQKLTSSIPK
jgi:ABC-type oligopeptide transport system ATPase subunit